MAGLKNAITGHLVLMAPRGLILEEFCYCLVVVDRLAIGWMIMGPGRVHGGGGAGRGKLQEG